MDFLTPNITTIAFFLLITVLICGIVYFIFKNKLNTTLRREAESEKKIKQLNQSISDSKEKIEQEKKQIDVKNKNLWKMSEAIHKEKDKIEKQNQELLTKRNILEMEKKKIEETNKKLWRSSVTILKEKDRIEKIKQLFEQKNQEITESIIYARRIQRATLPATEKMYNVFPESFIFYQPKELVSGDFYWFTTKDDNFLVSAVDCTGHGVPGAFMSMMGNDLLNYIVIEKGISEPEEILQELDRRIIAALKQSTKFTPVDTTHKEVKDLEGESGSHQVDPALFPDVTGDPASTDKLPDDRISDLQISKHSDNDVQDGMDISFCSIKLKNKLISYSGAKRPLYWIKKGELIKIDGNRFSIGGGIDRKKIFTNHQLRASQGDTIYMCSDGYSDQFGGEKDKKFMRKKFERLLIEIQSLSMKEQEKAIKATFDNWKGDKEQVDDVLVIGIKF